jgi:dihydrofolate reductase
MAKVVVSQFMSLDGVIEDPGGSEKWDRGGWAFEHDRGPEGDKFKPDDLVGAVTKLGQEPGGDILVNGSAQLVQALRANDLVDEYRLMVFPTVLGGGKRLFAEDGAATAVRLADTKPAGETLILTYEPASTEQAR